MLRPLRLARRLEAARNAIVTMHTVNAPASSHNSWKEPLLHDSRRSAGAVKTTRAQHTGAGGASLLFPPEAALKHLCAELVKELRQPIKGSFLRADGLDEVAASHVCTSSPHVLKETAVKQLPLLKPAKGLCTTVTTIGPLMPTALSAGVIVRDAEGTAMLLTLRNCLPKGGNLTVDEGQALFPEGTVLRLLEPYISRSLTGFATLRSDNPANLQIVSRPGLTLDAENSPERAVTLASEVQRRGDEHMAADRAAAALDCYSAGLALSELLPPTLKAELHRRRAAAALKLERFAAALLDCDRALALEPSHTEAALLRCDALLGTGRSAGAVSFATQQLASCDRADEAAWIAALAKAREAEATRAGRVDIMTMPFTLEGQVKHGTATYVGPIAVRDTRTSRGWGVYLTGDVKAGELLIVERPLATCWLHIDDVKLRPITNEGLPDHGITAHLIHLVQTPGADADGQIAAKLGTLSGKFGPRWATEPPSEAALRGEQMLPVPPVAALSARRIRGITESNCHKAWARDTEPTAAQRRPLTWVLDPAAVRTAAAVQGLGFENSGTVQVIVGTRLQAAAINDFRQALDAATKAGRSVDPRALAMTAADAATGPSALKQVLATMSPAEVKAEINAPDRMGGTLLHISVGYGRLEDVQALLAAGADPNLFDKRGMTPLHVAVMSRCNEAIVRLLLDAGADVNAIMPGSKTPLDHAVLGPAASASMVRLLLSRGADPRILAPEAGNMSLLDVVHSLESDVLSVRQMLGLTHGKGRAKVEALAAAGYDFAAFARETQSATGLYWITSFINHELGENTFRTSVGGTMIVAARHDMRAGTELSSGYTMDPEALKERGL